MNVLSLFDGISCGMVALERAGIPVDEYIAYEIEENAIKVSQHNYPQIKQCGDVFKADFTQYEGFDLLIGGSPCTYWSVSKAGGGEKSSTKREKTARGLGWDLFSQFVRALDEAKPKYFMYENNFSMSDEIKDCISEALGCYPILINSADFSAQNRKRYYWTNIPIAEWTKSEVLFCDIEDEISEKKIRDFSKHADTVRISKDGKSCSWDTSGKGYYSQANRCKKTDQKWNTLPSSGDDKNNIWLGDYKCRLITPIEAERLQTLPDNYTSCLAKNAKRVEVIGNGWTVDVIAHIFTGLKKEVITLGQINA